MQKLVTCIRNMKNLFYQTDYGQCFKGDIFELSQNYFLEHFKNKIQLIITSPPFPLNNKKKYGNLKGDEYKNWFVNLAPIFSQLLTENGSLVIEIGNAWEPERPVQSTLHLECLFDFVKNEKSDLRLIQEFISYNPSKLPGPAQWVTINRWRTVDSYTHIWWLANCDFPKANNSKVLRPYSKSMKRLLEKKKFNSGKRPSEHKISENAFFKNNTGSIAHNFFELEPMDEKREVRLPHNVLSFSNTVSNDYYQNICRKEKLNPHPARMHPGLVNFFIEFLTDEGDLIFDPFAGSNTTGYCAELLKRRWICSEINEEYIHQSMIRFEDPIIKSNIKYSFSKQNK